MRSGATLVLLGITAVVAYSIGHQNAASSSVPMAMTAAPSVVAKPVAFYSPAVGMPAAPVPAPSSPTSPSPSPAKADVTEKPSNADNAKRKAEVALTAAAIAAIIVQASRDQYHAGGRPCACPDDRMRNGHACGGRSAYSRPGGASPLCYPTDVTAAMIENYRSRVAQR
jgi:hypothetical protein